MTIIERLYQFIKYQNISIRNFEKSISASDGMIRRAINNNTEIQSKWLTNVSEKYHHLNLDWLITGKGEMLKKINNNPMPMESGRKETETKVIQNLQALSTSKRTVCIPIINIKDKTCYEQIRSNSPSELGEVLFPSSFLEKKQADYYCGKVLEESMAPTLLYDDLVVFRLLLPEEWINIKNNDIYIIVNQTGDYMIKRVVNKLRTESIIVAESDNTDRQYGNIRFHVNEIKNIYHVEWRFSNDMSNINQLYFSRLDRLEKRIESLQEIVKGNKKL